MNYKKFLIKLIIILLAIIPVFILISQKNDVGFYSYESLTHMFGQIAGLMGMTLFAITFILSTRMKFIEDAFGGLDKVYGFHGKLGGTALIFILFHPLLLVFKFIPDKVNLAAKYLLPSSIWSVNLGIIALFIMIILICITLYSRMKYHRWKFYHEFLGIVFTLAVLHIFLVRGTVAQDNIFDGYLIYAITISIIGLCAFIYSLFLRSKVAQHGEYKIKTIRKLANDVYELVLSPKNNPIKYKSGQFVFLKFKNSKIGSEPHPFSIASSSNNESLKVVIKSLGDFTSRLNELNVGEDVSIEGPYGRFNYELGGKDQIWIAGGIGITPFIGMAEDLAKNKDKLRNVKLYYTAKTSEEFSALKELKDAESKNSNFKLNLWDTKSRGYIKVENVIDSDKSFKDKDFYICGPESLKKSMIDGLLKRGVVKSKIHVEDFGFR